MQFSTNLLHGDHGYNDSTAVIAPISLSSTFSQQVPGQGAFDYSRAGNPNRLAFESLLALLELPKNVEDAALRPPFSTDHPPPALAFASGSACTAAIVQSLVRPGKGAILAVSDVYGGTRRYLSRVASATNVDTIFLDLYDDKASAVQAMLEENWQPDTQMIWLETPTNPTLRIVNIRTVAEFAHRKGAIVVVDNTFASPYFSRPLSLGADIVTHSVTKYINGHSDVVGGACISTRLDLIAKMRFYQNAAGAVPSPFDCWLAIRGARTLELRMQRHALSAFKIAQWLKADGAKYVDSVMYPGMDGFQFKPEQRAILWSQLSPEAEAWLRSLGYDGSEPFPFSGMVSFRTKVNPDRFLGKLRVFTLAESLGGVESLANLPSKMTHASVSPEFRAKLGIDDQLVRLSVGIENVDDLIQDLDQAFSSS